jgi:hypothetical protein
MDFFMNRLEPMTALASHLMGQATGSTQGPEEQTIREFVPLFLQAGWDALHHGDAWQVPVAALWSFFGGGVQTYEPTRQRKTR